MNMYEYYKIYVILKYKKYMLGILKFLFRLKNNERISLIQFCDIPYMIVSNLVII